VSPVAQETQAKMENQVALVPPVFTVFPVVPQWSAKTFPSLPATRALQDHQDQLVPLDSPEIPVTLEQPDTQEMLVVQDPSDLPDLPDLAVLPDPPDPSELQETQQPALPIRKEMQDNQEMPAQKDHKEMPAHKDPLDPRAPLETRDHPVLEDLPEKPEPPETLALQEMPETKENEANVPNTAVWMVESSSKMEPESERDNNNDYNSPSSTLFSTGFNCFRSVLVGSFRNLSKIVYFSCTLFQVSSATNYIQLIIYDRSNVLSHICFF